MIQNEIKSALTPTKILNVLSSGFPFIRITDLIQTQQKKNLIFRKVEFKNLIFAMNSQIEGHRFKKTISFCES